MSNSALEFLFDTSQYPARWECGHWLPTIGWTHITSDIIIFLAYTGIPISLIYYQNKINALNINYIFILFASFIFFCGATHLIEAIIFWHPIYNFAGLIKSLTAMVSLTTLLVITLKLPSTLKFIKEKIESKKIKQELNVLKANEAQKANSAKDKFLATMSHELRTPLNAIIGYTGILLMRLPGSLNPEQQKQLKIIQNSSKHLLSLINDILDLSKIESGKIELHLESVNCHQVVQEVINTVMPSCNAKGLMLNYIAPNTSIYLKTDPRTFTQIILNLTNNAVKFTEKGSINIEISHLQDEIAIKITDTGIGIKTEDKAKLFQVFQQISLSGKLVEGTGLGLHLSQKLANLLNGRIEVESIFGQGSCFSLILPCKQDAIYG